MCKSKGTGIDPLPVMEEFGTDALRFTLLVGSTPGNDMNISLKKVEGNRNFANKIWNAGRFVISAPSTAFQPIADRRPQTNTSPDHCPMSMVSPNGLLPTVGFGRGCNRSSAKWSACSRPINTARPDARSTSSSGMILPTGTWKWRNCKWLGRRTCIPILRRPWRASWIFPCACCTPSLPL